jgi:phage-related protein
VTGTDQETVLGRVQAAFRGRTAGLKDYGVEVDKGADKTGIFNAFMSDTEQYAGRSDTAVGNLHGTMGDLTAQLGLALIPVIMTFLPLFQQIADFAKNNKVAFDIIVIALAAVALAFSVATVAAGAFGITTMAGLWPIMAVVGGIIALIAIIAVVIRYWDNIVTALKKAWEWIDNVGEKFGWIIAFMGPLGLLIAVVTNFSTVWSTVKSVVDDVWRAIQKVIDVASQIVTGTIDAFKSAWDQVKDAIDAVKAAIQKVIDIAKTAADKVGDVLSKIPLINKIPGISSVPPGAAGVSTYGAATTGPIVFAPAITISGDIGDPVLAGRRIVAALEAWTAANGRRRVAALVNP